VGEAADAAPALTTNAIGTYVETPADLSARTGADNGCYYHVDMVPLTHIRPRRPVRGISRHRTPIRGLYLASAGTHPSGGVSGVPGMHAARAVLAG
jgi:phytoene dehydrogenase-like protein